MRIQFVVAALAAFGLFASASAQPAPGGRIFINQLSGKCLDVPGVSNMTDGTELQLWDCEFSGLELGGEKSDQFWIFGPSGTIRNSLAAFCIDITGTNNGDAIQIRRCDGRASQIWVVRQDGFIQNQITGKCIDVAGAPGVNSGARLQILDCEFGNPQTDQRWRY